ncbi:hypothetical protein R3P38DRAFT_471439 [Favolaschia claudopus]|uniref:Uncharacterized protein n=1 Tax=Favolaschia claudopus TaxID=2862362 RepID=A0AAV9ZDS3_9AGAR
MERGMAILLMIQSTLVETTLCLRILAMYGRTLAVMVPLGLIGAVTAGLGLWTIIKIWEPQMMWAPELTGCHTAIPKDTALRLAGVWEAQFVLDLVVFGLTLYRGHLDRAVISMVPGSLMERLMRDGAMYFGVIVLASLADILTLYFGDIMIAGILSWWTTSLSVTLVSRLILNLHRAGYGNSGVVSQHYTTEVNELHFAEPNQRPAVDSLGSSLSADVSV